MSENLRQPAVAGTFYPADPQALSSEVDDYLAQAATRIKLRAQIPKALIVPHAGYIYSAPVAASAYLSQQAARELITRVVLLGPSHRVPFTGLAVCSASHYVTPLGLIPLDQAIIESLTPLPQVTRNDTAHLYEHSLEVQLPFLQQILDQFTLVPLVVGEADAESVAQVLEQVWGDEHTLIVISSDLSHYHDYDTARELDQATTQAIETLDPAAIQYENACGRNPVNGLLLLAKEKNMQVETVDLRNSGDTAGPRDQVVGYGAYLFYDEHA